MATAIYAVIVLILSVMPTGAEVSVPHLDKLVHLCEYLVFAYLLLHALRATLPEGRDLLLRTWLFATGYGLLMEAAQMMVPWRSADLSDGLVNALGAAAGAWIAHR